MKEYAINIKLCGEAIDRLTDRIACNEDHISKTMEAINIDIYAKDGKSLQQFLNSIQGDKNSISEDIGYLRENLRKMIIYVHLLTDAAEERKKTL